MAYTNLYISSTLCVKVQIQLKPSMVPKACAHTNMTKYKILLGPCVQNTIYFLHFVCESPNTTKANYLESCLSLSLSLSLSMCVCVCIYIYILCIQKKVCKNIKPGDLEIWLRESFWKEGVHLDE